MKKLTVLKKYLTSKRVGLYGIALLLTLNIIVSMVPLLAFNFADAETPTATEVATYEELKSAVDSKAATILLTADIEAPNTAELVFSGGGMYVIDGDGHTITRDIGAANSLITVVNASADRTQLELRDIIIDGSSALSADSTSTSPLVTLGNGTRGGILGMTDAVLRCNNNTSTTNPGGGVQLLSGDGTDGTVAALFMGGSSIEHCEATRGGGVYGSGSIYCAPDGGLGTISDCTATGEGGGVYFTAPVGGELGPVIIADNTAARGAGVYSDSQLRLNGEADNDAAINIYGNTATTAGGGVYMADGAAFLLGDGEFTAKINICGNKVGTAANNVRMSGAAAVLGSEDTAVSGAVGFNNIADGEQVATCEYNCASLFVPDSATGAVTAGTDANTYVYDADADAEYATITISLAHDYQPTSADTTGGLVPSGTVVVPVGEGLSVEAYSGSEYWSVDKYTSTKCSVTANESMHENVVNVYNCTTYIVYYLENVQDGATLTVTNTQQFGTYEKSSSDGAAVISGDYVNKDVTVKTAAKSTTIDDSYFKDYVDTQYGDDYAEILFDKIVDFENADVPFSAYEPTELKIKVGTQYSGDTVDVFTFAVDHTATPNKYNPTEINAVTVDANGYVSLGDVSSYAFFHPDGIRATIVMPYVAQIGTGTSAKKYTSLADACSAAKDGDTVYVTNNCYVSSPITIDKDLLIRPVMEGKTSTIIRGKTDSDGKEIFKITDKSTLALCNMVISGATESETPVTAPLIHAQEGSTLALGGIVSLVDNENLTGKGGAVLLTGATLQSVECKNLAGNAKYTNDINISGNSAKLGGGVYCEKTSKSGSSVLGTVSPIVIKDNGADKGGAIYAEEGTTIENVTASENTAATAGGGVYADDINLGGNIVITANTANDSSNNLYLETGAKITVPQELSSASKIGIASPQKSKALIAKAGTGASLDGCKDCFFCDTLNFYPVINTAKNEITLSEQADSTYYAYNVYVSSEDGGVVYPSGAMRVYDGQTITIDPDGGKMIDKVTVSTGKADGTGTPALKKTYTNSDIDIVNYIGTLKIKSGDLAAGDEVINYISVSYKDTGDTKYTVTGKHSKDSETDGGSIMVGATNGKEKATAGSSKAITFTPQSLAYDLTAVEVDGEEIDIDDLELQDDGAIYKYTLNDIRSDVTVEATFEKMYVKKDNGSMKPANDVGVTAGGNLIRKTASLVVTELTSGEDFDALKAEIAKSTGYTMGRAYDITFTASDSKEPYRSAINLTFFVGTGYAGKTVYVYHINEAESKIENSLSGVVDSTGFVTVLGATDFSPYATALPTGGSTNKTITSLTPTTATTPAGTAPTLPSTVKVTYSDGTTADLPVTWTQPTAAQYATAGTAFTVKGTVAGTTLEALCTVTVTKASSGTGGTGDTGGTGGTGGTGSSNSGPKSGDNVVLLTIMAAVFGVSIVALIVMAVSKKKKKDE